MIISASRRTDIPAFYGEWLLNRLLKKEVLVRNPMNPNSISKISLDPKNIDCIVFWTKDPKNFLKYISRIEELGYNFYFQFTITAYDTSIEKKVETKNEIINTFIKLSKMIGKERVIWRYDPIFINDKYNNEYHIKWFEYLCSKLSKYTEKCVISFVDEYNFNKKELEISKIKELEIFEIINIAKDLKKISNYYQIELATCSEKIDLSNIDIKHNKCIDDELISRITKKKIIYGKDNSQREECGCIASRDIGSYNSCLHNCVYCYARRGSLKAEYDPDSPMLCDRVIGNEKITIAPVKITDLTQGELF